MKKIYKDKILNIEKTELFDNKFLFSYLDVDYDLWWVDVFYIWDLLRKKENRELMNNVKLKPAIWSEVYSPKDEFEIFIELFDYAINNNKKIHIIWITLQEELELLENYYIEKWYLRKDVNCFIVDYSEALVTVSVNIENLIWRWSDYKANWKKIFFVPPIRESWQNKAMFKWINRWSIAWIHINKLDDEKIKFLSSCLNNESILPLTLWKVLNYNLEEIWFKGELNDFELEY